MAKITSPLIGANLNKIEKAAEIAGKGGQPSIAVLTSGFTDTNKRAVYGKAAAALSSGLTTCAISSTGDVTASGGTFVAPTVTGGLSIGDYAWFVQAYPA
jgi:hypothetical protein